MTLLCFALHSSSGLLAVDIEIKIPIDGRSISTASKALKLKGKSAERGRVDWDLIGRMYKHFEVQ